MVYKVAFLGPPAAGKTTIRKCLFEGTSPDELLARSEPPTIGMKFTRYQYMFSEAAGDGTKNPRTVPVDIALVDTAGQELEKWLHASARDVFSGCSVVFYLFDVQDWFDDVKRRYHTDLVLFINDRRLELAPGSLLHVIPTKFDLLGRPASDIKAIEHEVRGGLEDRAFALTRLMLQFPVHVSSLAVPFRAATFTMFSQILAEDLLFA